MGYETVREACPECRGDGHLSCPDCNGAGIRYDIGEPCLNCRGSGRLNCPTCYGRGKVEKSVWKDDREDSPSLFDSSPSDSSSSSSYSSGGAGSRQAAKRVELMDRVAELRSRGEEHTASNNHEGVAAVFGQLADMLESPEWADYARQAISREPRQKRNFDLLAEELSEYRRLASLAYQKLYSEKFKKKDYDGAVNDGEKYVKYCINGNWEPAMMTLGILYYMRGMLNGAKGQKEKAIADYEAAAALDYGYVQEQLTERGIAYAPTVESLSRQGLAKSRAGHYAAAFALFRQAANMGGAESQCNLGYFYEKGYGVAQDTAKAFEWTKKSAEGGSAQGQLNLGIYYSEGFGVKRSHAKAKVWYEKAAAQGNEQAKEELAKLQKLAAANRRGIAIALLFAALCGFGIFPFVDYATLLITGAALPIEGVALAAAWLAPAVVGFFAWRAWRGERHLLKVVLVLVAASGIWLHYFGGYEQAKAYITEKFIVQTGIVTASTLSIRATPAANAVVVTRLKKGDRLKVTGKSQGGWTPVEYMGAGGWVSSSHIAITDR